MSTVINMPQVGQDIEFARIIEWHVSEGDEIKEGDILAIVESDKASFEVESSEAGTVLKLLFKEGDEAPIFKPIAYIGQKDEFTEKLNEKISSAATIVESKSTVTSVKIDHARAKVLFSSPSARRIARENNVELPSLTGSGPNGRIIRKDVEAFYKVIMPEIKITPVAKKISEETGVNFDSLQGTGYGGRVMKKDVISSVIPVRSVILKESPGDQVVLYSKAKKRTAERLTFSKLTIPHYYLFIDVDVTNTLSWRNKTNSQLGIKISINDIIIKSTSEALRKFQGMNSWVDDEKMVIKPEINIGVAVSTDLGLLVPVIPEADKLDLIEINNLSIRNTEDARRGIIHMDKPGTFTVSNLGMYGISRFLPIINPPECAILSVGTVEKKVMPKDDAFVVIENLTLGLACDHRAVDGTKASEFLSYLKETIANFSD
jgi:pyruvate dehydrogenase E2 component (dihydrolipoamide acetyltransferase)